MSKEYSGRFRAHKAAQAAEQEAAQVIARELLAIDYRRFKPAVKDGALHAAYLSAWSSLPGIQGPGTGGIYNHAWPGQRT